MSMKLGPGEPPADPWRVMPTSDIVRLVFDADRARDGRPWILAVDAHRGSGKSTIANLFHLFVPASAVVHTDDVAWHHSFFDWSDLLIEGILKPLRNGQAVSYRPPAGTNAAGLGRSRLRRISTWSSWKGSGPAGLSSCPGSTARCGCSPTLRKPNAAASLGTAAPRAAKNFWREWGAQEFDFLQRQRTWERATIIVNGTPTQSYDQSTEIVVAPALY
jgi:hypothetical protein